MAAAPVTTVRSTDALRQIAQGQIDSEIAGQTAPLTSEIGSERRQQGADIAQIGATFGNLMPYVRGSAQQVQTSWDAANSAQHQIFDAATQRLNDLKQARAAEAQAMAQEMGGPVAMTEFSRAIDPAEAALGPTASGSMLHGLALAQAGTQEAQAFAGRVFPALRTEEEAQARFKHEDNIKKLQDQITALQGQKTGKVNARLNDLLESERTFQLNKATGARDQARIAHDWYATKQGLAQEKQKIDLANRQFALDKEIQRGQLGVQKGQLTLDQNKLTESQREFDKTYGQNERQMNKEFILKNKQLNASAKLNGASLMDNAMNPGAPQTVTNSTQVEVSAPKNLRKPPSGYYARKGVKDKDHPDGVHWYVIKNITQTIPSPKQPITDATQMAKYLIANGIPRAQAIGLVRARFHRGPQWVPGYKPPKKSAKSDLQSGRPGEGPGYNP